MNGAFLDLPELASAKALAFALPSISVKPTAGISVSDRADWDSYAPNDSSWRIRALSKTAAFTLWNGYVPFEDVAGDDADVEDLRAGVKEEDDDKNDVADDDDDDFVASEDEEEDEEEDEDDDDDDDDEEDEDEDDDDDDDEEEKMDIDPDKKEDGGDEKQKRQDNNLAPAPYPRKVPTYTIPSKLSAAQRAETFIYRHETNWAKSNAQCTTRIINIDDATQPEEFMKAIKSAVGEISFDITLFIPQAVSPELRVPREDLVECLQGTTISFVELGFATKLFKIEDATFSAWDLFYDSLGEDGENAAVNVTKKFTLRLPFFHHDGMFEMFIADLIEISGFERTVAVIIGGSPCASFDLKYVFDVDGRTLQNRINKFFVPLSQVGYEAAPVVAALKSDSSYKPANPTFRKGDAGGSKRKRTDDDDDDDATGSLEKRVNADDTDMEFVTESTKTEGEFYFRPPKKYSLQQVRAVFETLANPTAPDENQAVFCAVLIHVVPREEMEASRTLDGIRARGRGGDFLQTGAMSSTYVLRDNANLSSFAGRGFLFLSPEYLTKRTYRIMAGNGITEPYPLVRLFTAGTPNIESSIMREAHKDRPTFEDIFKTAFDIYGIFEIGWIFAYQYLHTQMTSFLGRVYGVRDVLKRSGLQIDDTAFYPLIGCQSNALHPKQADKIKGSEDWMATVQMNYGIFAQQFARLCLKMGKLQQADKDNSMPIEKRISVIMTTKAGLPHPQARFVDFPYLSAVYNFSFSETTFKTLSTNLKGMLIVEEGEEQSVFQQLATKRPFLVGPGRNEIMFRADAVDAGLVGSSSSSNANADDDDEPYNDPTNF